jgi:MFS family permease
MAAVVSAEREPAHYGNLQHTALSAFWFGMNFLWIPLTTVLIQAQVDEVVPKGSQNTAIGVALGLGGVLAMAVPPLVGAWSDRLNTRFGRRRPIMVAGTLLTIPGLLILMAANNYPEIVIGYAIIQFFFNGAGAAYAGIIPDVVPAQQVGKASGFLATMTQLGIGGGLGVTSLLSHNRAIYLVMGVVAALCLIPTVWAARTEGMEPIAPPPHRPFSEAVREFLRPLHEGDFAWVVFTRLMVSSGITVVLYFLVNFFGDVVLTPGTDAAKFTDNWLLVVVVTALPFGFFGGQISDRIRRRKILATGSTSRSTGRSPATPCLTKQSRRRTWGSSTSR